MMLNLRKIKPYADDVIKQNEFFCRNLKQLTKHHFSNSEEYKKFLIKSNYNLKNNSLEEFPFLPSNIFKEIELKSINSKKIYKILTSSGTSGKKLSKIFLDRNNAQNQIIALSKLIETILGEKRLPMLIVDQNPRNNSFTFSARVAAINGFSIFGYDYTYLFNSKNKIDHTKLKTFLKKYTGKPFFVFGFTSLIYKSFFQDLKKYNYDFNGGILLHGGGWKKLEKNKIDNKRFKKFLSKKYNFENIYNYYGMVEQTGSIFLECKYCSCFVTSSYSNVLIRDKNFNIIENGKEGLIQLLSLLPTSYPGHSIITEDIGVIVNKTICVCSSQGKRFKVLGRARMSEIRGCSDTI